MQNCAQLEWSFEWWYFGPCVRKITLQCVIWIVQFKWWSRGIFQWRISQITQQNNCMNALTSKLWFGGRATCTCIHVRDLLITSAFIPRAAYVQKHSKRELRATCLIGRVPRHEPRIFFRSGMQNRNLASRVYTAYYNFKLCNSNDHSNCTLSFRVKTVDIVLINPKHLHVSCASLYCVAQRLSFQCWFCGQPVLPNADRAGSNG